MNNEMRLARVDLGPDWIDLSYGEPVAIQKILKSIIDVNVLPEKESFLNAKYQPPQGNVELVKLLENKYKTNVVVTNGAKQGMAAVMHALKKLNNKGCAIHSPYWTSTPNIVVNSGLKLEIVSDKVEHSTAMMITSPNNPDGKELSKDQLLELTKEAAEAGIALIHDAAYYTPVYMAQDERVNVGDAQIYSVAKMYGLSGLRVGYVVVHNNKLLPFLKEFTEQSCSGVSTASQGVVLAIERFFEQNPDKLNLFMQRSREAIANNRALLTKLDPEVIDILPCDSNSMFAWGKAGPKLNYKETKVNILPGEIFGQEGYVRFNIAVDPDLIETAIDRLNRGCV